MSSSNAQNLHFQHLTTEDGLSDNAITCIFEDRAGYIWIGTERGLNRYDGQRVDRFPPGATGPVGAHITSIAEDTQGRLYFTTADEGLSMRDGTGRFTHFRYDNRDVRWLPDGLNHVLVLNDSTLVISSRGSGAIWYHPRTGIIRRVGFRPVVIGANGDTTKRRNDDWCHSAVRLDEDRIALHMLRVPGPQIIDARSGERLSAVDMPKTQLTNGAFIDGVLYMGGWSPGLFRAGPDLSSTVHCSPVEDEITAIAQWDGGQLIAATKVGGLLRLDKDGTKLGRCQHLRSDPSSLRSDRTTCLLRDREGNLWVGTAKGLSVHAPSVWRFTALPLLPEGRPGDLVFHAIQQDDDGTIRISTSKGFFLVDPDQLSSRLVELSHEGIPLEVTGLFHPAEEGYFAGTETGIFRYEPVKERILPGTGTGRWSSYHAGSMFQVRSVQTHPNRGLLIIGALGYAHIALDRRSGKRSADWADHPHAPGTMMLRATHQDNQGFWWSATTGGVVRWKPVAVGARTISEVFSTRAAAPRTLPGNDAQALAIQGDTVWVALRDAGLASIVGDRATAHPPPAHLSHDALGVIVDRSGMVWCTTSNGLLRFSPKDGSWLHVPVNDGRAFRQLTKCMTTLKDGRIALCADDHLLLFDPDAYHALPELPRAALVSTRNNWGELRVDADGMLELPYHNSAFDAMLTALRPVGASPLTFLYRLDSEGDGYHEVDARSPVRYAGVRTGSHELFVRVRDHYGREGPEAAVLTVHVTGPFWQQGWFFLLVIAAGALGMHLISRFRRRQRARLQGVRDRIARDLHDDIGSTLGSISFYSEALRRKLSTHGDRMTLDVAERIGSSSREMIDRMSDIVWSVDPKNDDAGALVERLRSFARDLLSARDIALHFHAEPALNERKLSAEQRRNLFLICKEALHNTVKYADARTVSIRMSGGSRGVMIHIADDGRGFDTERTDSHNGNGLVNMHARAGSIHAVLRIESAPGKGTRVELLLPAPALVPRSGD
ncbi:MAG: hypothetical protein IT227_14450 [Flavobacteriales bacterium]|nr:hypothetical protein [Flavobacteriales bacterium]